MRKTLVFLILTFLYAPILISQDSNFKSIHQEQSNYYSFLGLKTTFEYDSIQKFSFSKEKLNTQDDTLVKRVFGYFPYWAGSNYLNYQWDLLSDFCFFSYEVDPLTGSPLNLYDWETSPAIDSALANNVQVHLCVTLFSNHSTFFGNADAQQTLINNIISLIQNRGAHGVNMDIEALPNSQGNAFTDFMIALNEQMSEMLPEAEVSIASPAVNWSGTFDIPALNQIIDFYMVMTYDYYWNGSSQAGPVSPIYSMTSYYDYSFSKTISYYQSKGVPNHKIIAGVPYYARQWATEGQYAPSDRVGYGTAYTYRYIKSNSSGNYSSDNLHIEPNSLSPYYSYQNNGWIQCFVDNEYSLGKKYDQVNRKNLAGIGIWALGYDNGYSELWELIADKFTKSATIVNADTIYDSGGPAMDYYDKEDYLYTITTADNSNVYLSFSYLNTEQVYDSLLIYDGSDTSANLLGEFSGDSVPLLITASSNLITLKFKSDNGITSSGWRAVYDTLPVSALDAISIQNSILVYPNPAMDWVFVSPQEIVQSKIGLQIHSSSGQLVLEKYIYFQGQPFTISTRDWKPGIYFISFSENGVLNSRKKLIIK